MSNYDANISAAVPQAMKDRVAAFMELHEIHESEAVRRLLALGLSTAHVPLDGSPPSTSVSAMTSEQP